LTRWHRPDPTAWLVLADGTRLSGAGIGATGMVAAEVCFNTAMTGYQEILTDPSYAGQIITFTFPHIGNVGTNPEDMETANPAPIAGVRGAVLRAPITEPASYRSIAHLNAWLKARNIIGIAGVDTRALTTRIRQGGMPRAVLAHHPDGVFDDAAMAAELEGFSGLEGLDLAGKTGTAQSYGWDGAGWVWPTGHGTASDPQFHVVAIDYGAKSNIFRCLVDNGARVTVVPPTSSAAEILELKPDGVFLSNGPGDPAATARYAGPVISELVNSGVPMFGICLGHQLLALALGAKTQKMHQGHHGANHPVMDNTTSKVEIVSMNHGFAVDKKSLPPDVKETHISLFDGSNCGLVVTDKPVFSVQHHPEASPGPRDSHYLFVRFFNHIRASKNLPQVPEFPVPESAPPRAAE